jgi:hypothetical protein
MLRFIHGIRDWPDPGFFLARRTGILKSMKIFKTRIRIVGVNQYVLVPQAVVDDIFRQAGQDQGPIPIEGQLDGKPFTQMLVKYGGRWRVYLSKPIRKAAGKDVGDRVEVHLAYDGVDRPVPMHPKLADALSGNERARSAFEALSPSRQKEILRYINGLKQESSIDKNVGMTIKFLEDNTRDNP